MWALTSFLTWFFLKSNLSVQLIVLQQRGAKANSSAPIVSINSRHVSLRLQKIICLLFIPQTTLKIMRLWHSAVISAGDDWLLASFWYNNNLCRDNCLRGLSRVVIGELDGRKREWLSVIRGSLLGRALRPQACLHVCRDGRSDANEIWQSRGMKQVWNKPRFKLSFCSCHNIKPPHVSWFHVVPVVNLLFTSSSPFLSSPPSAAHLWFANIANMLLFHLYQPHFIAQ